MQSDDSSHNDFHHGHDLETGMVARAREWTDLFPWLRLVRVLRTAASPPLLFLVAITFLIWWLGITFLFGEKAFFAFHEPGRATVFEQGTLRSPTALFEALSTFEQRMMPTAVVDVRNLPANRGLGYAKSMLLILWTLLTWLPTALTVSRQGSLLTAGRPLQGFLTTLIHSLRSLPKALLAAVVPLACVLLIAASIWGLGLVSKIFDGVRVLEFLCAIIVVLISIPCGLLAFGASFALPLGWAAIGIEKECDALDSLSRGYEYLLRRPIHLVLYVVVGVVLMMIIGVLAFGVANAAASIVATACYWSGASAGMANTSHRMVMQLPWIIVITLFWAIVGGGYLLLRRDAGGQEVEDLEL